MSNNIKDLRDILFNQLKRLNNDKLTAEDLDKEAHRTGQIVLISDEALSELEREDIKKKREVDLVIEQIHREFNTAGDILLHQAYEIINSTNVCTDKTEKLKSLGFRSVPEVKQVEDRIKEKQISEETVALIQKYRFEYPNNKFITDDMIKSICEKYGLVYGDIELFKGFVSLKNLNEIAAFVEKYPMDDIYVDELGREHNMTGFEIRKRGNFYHFFKDGLFGHAYQSNDGIRFYGDNYTGKTKEEHYTRLGVNYLTVHNMKKKSLKICAPLKDMNMKPNQRLNGHIIIDWPDPVVMRPVKGGGIICSAWGDEASDELVINHNNN